MAEQFDLNLSSKMNKNLVIVKVSFIIIMHTAQRNKVMSPINRVHIITCSRGLVFYLIMSLKSLIKTAHFNNSFYICSKLRKKYFHPH